MSTVREVGFELERFEWSGERLEVVGRWSGLRGRRLSRPVLVLDAGGRRVRLNALPGGQLRAGSDEPWRATFAWDADGEDVRGAELEIGRSLIVELPAPRRRAPRPATPPVERAEQA